MPAKETMRLKKMQELIPFSSFYISASQLNLMFMNAYNPLGPKDRFATSNTLMKMILLPVTNLVKKILKSEKVSPFLHFITNTSLLPDWVIAFCSL